MKRKMLVKALVEIKSTDLTNEYETFKRHFIREQKIFTKPILYCGEFEVYGCETDYEFRHFDKLIYGVASELLKCDIVFDEASFRFGKDFTIIEYSSERLLFYYEEIKGINRVIGVAVLAKQYKLHVWRFNTKLKRMRFSFPIELPNVKSIILDPTFILCLALFVLLRF
ncbi:hypothetical protein PGB90_008918 [Kerria lacca]